MKTVCYTIAGIVLVKHADTIDGLVLSVLSVLF